jgi:hypothetical protein
VTLDPAATISAARHRLAAGGIGIPDALVVPLSDLLGVAYDYAAMTRWREYPLALKGLAVADAVLGLPVEDAQEGT